MSNHLIENPSLKNSSSKTGVLITNLGSPDTPTKKALRKYLGQFLSDKFAKKYQKIWSHDTHEAPLISLCQKLLKKLKI
jgi:protoheme ferro-lyase